MPKFETIQLHGGQKPDTATAAMAVPIYATSSYVFSDSQNASDAFSLQAPSYVYSRIANPTNEVFENRINELEGGIGAVAVASGQAAQTLALGALASVGDNIVASSHLYGGSYNLLKVSLKRLGIEVRFVEGEKSEDYEKVIDDRTRGIYVESIGNPGYDVPDFEGLSALALKHGTPLVVDNTFGGAGYIVRPFDHGAHIIVHSATKWIGGHGTTIGGIIVDSGKFPWGNFKDKFPNITGPSPAYHGLNWYDKFQDKAFIFYTRLEQLRDLGPALNPFGAFLLLQGTETLSLRLDRHQENAQKVSEWLEQNPHVVSVSYLGSDSHRSHELAKKYFQGNGFGSMISFEVKDGKSASVVDNLKIASNLANVGDAKTLVIAPWMTTHSQLSEEEKKQSDVTEGLIRLSVGLENIDDIIGDFDQAFKAVYR